jgi:hypothetical protein
MLIVLPALGAAAYMQMAMAVGGEESGAIPELIPSSTTASSVIMHSSLLASLGRSADYLETYRTQLYSLRNHYHVAALKESAAHFLMQTLMFSAFGIAFYVGAILVDDGTCSVDGMVQAVFGLIFCACTVSIRHSSQFSLFTRPALLPVDLPSLFGQPLLVLACSSP